jgi:hypothetical protein
MQPAMTAASADEMPPAAAAGYQSGTMHATRAKTIFCA